jgi:hypothetical protein
VDENRQRPENVVIGAGHNISQQDLLKLRADFPNTSDSLNFQHKFLGDYASKVLG